MDKSALATQVHQRQKEKDRVKPVSSAVKMENGSPAKDKSSPKKNSVTTKMTIVTENQTNASIKKGHRVPRKSGIVLREVFGNATRHRQASTANEKVALLPFVSSSAPPT